MSPTFRPLSRCSLAPMAKLDCAVAHAPATPSITSARKTRSPSRACIFIPNIADLPKFPFKRSRDLRVGRLGRRDLRCGWRREGMAGGLGGDVRRDQLSHLRLIE